MKGPSTLSYKIYKRKTKIKSNLERKPKNPSFWPLALRWTTLYVALQGVFIGAEGRRVLDEVAHEIWYPDKLKVPQNCGFCRNSAAKVWRLATRFGAWPLLVRPCGRLLLEVWSWLFILGFRDNLIIKLPRFWILPISFKRISLSLHSFHSHLQEFRVG